MNGLFHFISFTTHLYVSACSRVERKRLSGKEAVDTIVNPKQMVGTTTNAKQRADCEHDNKSRHSKTSRQNW